MRWLFAPFNFLFKLWIGFVFWTTLALLYPIFAFNLAKPERYPRAFRWKRRWSALLSALILCPVRAEKRGEIPEGPVLFVSNHSSYSDTFFFYSAIDRYFLFIGKGELLKWPLFSLFFRTMDIPISRKDFRQAKGALSKAADALERGESVAIYPEGTIARDNPRLTRFKNGAFKLAIDTQVPIVPMTWTTNWKILKDPEDFFSVSRPAISRVVIHPAIDTRGMGPEDLVALREQVWRAVDSGLPAEFRQS